MRADPNRSKGTRGLCVRAPENAPLLEEAACFFSRHQHRQATRMPNVLPV